MPVANTSKRLFDMLVTAGVPKYQILILKVLKITNYKLKTKKREGQQRKERISTNSFILKKYKWHILENKMKKKTDKWKVRNNWKMKWKMKICKMEKKMN